MRAASSSQATHIAIAAVAIVVLSALSAWGLTRLIIDDDLRIDSRVVNPKWVRLEEIFWSFGSYDTDIIVVLEADDFFTPERAAALKKLVTAIEAQPPTADTPSPVRRRSRARRSRRILDRR